MKQKSDNGEDEDVLREQYEDIPGIDCHRS